METIKTQEPTNKEIAIMLLTFAANALKRGDEALCEAFSARAEKVLVDDEKM